MGELDFGAIRGGVEGYIGRSKEIFDADFLDYAEGEIESLQTKHGSGFSFPTNEGLRKITKQPEIDKTENDPVLQKVEGIIRTTINGVKPQKEGGIYAGVNAFHHGHIAYLSKSEAVVAVDFNKLVPAGFAFITGLVAGAKNTKDFREQIGMLAANPKILADIFENTELGKTALLTQDDEDASSTRQRLLKSFISVMDEFDPAIHGADRIPPVFCADEDAYNYFRTLVLQDKVAGAKAKLQGDGLMGILAKSMDTFKVKNPEINTLYTSSCFDPRFLGPKERGKFFAKLKEEGYSNIQIVESFLNSGWIVYDINKK